MKKAPRKSFVFENKWQSMGTATNFVPKEQEQAFIKALFILESLTHAGAAPQTHN